MSYQMSRKNVNKPKRSRTAETENWLTEKGVAHKKAKEHTGQ